MRRAATGMIWVMVLAGLAGCGGGTTVFIHPNSDFSSIKKVAILPFESVSKDPVASDKVQKILTSELLSLGAFEIVEPGQVLRAVSEADVTAPSAMTPAQIKKVGAALGAQSLILGTVVDFAETRGGAISAPDVTIQLRMVETQSGTTLWSASATRSGAKLRTRLFGVGGETTTQAAQVVLRQELRTLLVK